MFSKKDKNTTSATKTKKIRAWELDFLRGLSILLVVWDHTMYDLGYMFSYEWRTSGSAVLKSLSEFAISYMHSDLRLYGWTVFVFIFFFVSGICTTFSKNNAIRGLKLAVIAALLTLFTWIADRFIGFSGITILFGVLHCIAVCILFYAFVEFIVGLLNKKKNRFVMPIVCGTLAIAAIVCHFIFNVTLLEVNSTYAVVDTDCKIAGLFVYTEEWWSRTADYFPLLPFIGFFLAGAAIAPLVYPNKKSLLPKLDGKWHYVFTYPGRYSLIVYLASQVLVVGIIALITYLVTGGI